MRRASLYVPKTESNEDTISETKPILRKTDLQPDQSEQRRKSFRNISFNDTTNPNQQLNMRMSRIENQLDEITSILKKMTAGQSHFNRGRYQAIDEE